MAKKDEFAPKHQDIDCEWNSAGTSSDEIDIGGLSLIGISVPKSGGITGTSLKVKVSIGGALHTVYDNAGAGDYTITVAAEKFTPVTIPFFAATQSLVIVSDQSEAGAGEKVVLVCRPV